MSGNVPRCVTAMAASLLGEQVFHVILAWLAVTSSGPGMAAVVIAAGALPRIALMLGVSASVVDRLGPLRTVLGSDVARGVALFAGAGALVAFRPGPVVLIVLSVVFGLAEAAAEPATGMVAAKIASQEEQQRLHALRTRVYRFAMLFGGPAAAFAFLLGGPTAVLLNAALFAGAVAVMLFVRPLPAADPTPGAFGMQPGGERRGPLAEMRAGLGYVFGQPALRTALFCAVLLELGCAGAFRLGVPLLAQDRGWGMTGFGLLAFAIGLGTIAAALAPTFAKNLRSHGSTIATGCLVTAACLAVLPLLPGSGVGLAAGVAVAILLSLSAAVASAVTAALFFTLPRPDLMSSSIATLFVVSATVPPLAILLVGGIATWSSADLAFLVSAGAAALGGLVGLASPALRTAVARPPMPPAQEPAVEGDVAHAS